MQKTRVGDRMSAGLRMEQSRVYHDSDSDSDLDPVNEENDGQHDNSASEPQQGEQEESLWSTAVDPNSGKTYYFHNVTRETQWQKPIEMASREERAAVVAKERRQKDFFAAMEANIMKSISEGYKTPEKSSQLDTEFGNAILISDDPLPISSRHLSPRKGRLERSSSKGSTSSMLRPNLVRTISSMDTNVLRELIKRVPSSRQVRQGKTLPSGSIGSNRSLGYGSSNHSRQTRFGGLSARTSGARLGSAVAPERQKSASMFNRKDGNEEGDDEIPPLTVVTTADLRKREGLGLNAQDPRDMFSRRDSLTLDQLSRNGSGRGNLFDSRYFDQSAGSRLTMSNNSLALESNDSSRFMGISGSGSQSRLSRGGGFYANNHSLNSFGSSDSQRSLGQGMDSSGMSVGSNPLMPVEEGHDESEYSDPRVAAGRQRFLGGETNLLEQEGSFSLGAGSDDLLIQSDTANWLDTLPSDASATREDIVGYGNDAKPFSDAGFTSFFDESMANFDLSDKETQALQKLAMISEQMTKVAEAEESDETDESEEIDEDDDDMPDLNDAGSGFPFFLESSEDEEASDEEQSSHENEGTPSMHTPTSGTMKTSETSSTTASPVRRPVRGLGQKTSRIPRAVRSKQIREAILDDDDSNSTRGSLTADGSFAVSKLALASATLTSDNARSHEAPQISLTVDNPRSHISEIQPQRRHVGDIHWSPPKNDELSNSASSLNSANSIAMANAARRLSMFQLKGIDRSRLRVIGDGKGSSPGSDVKSVQTLHESGAQVDGPVARPNLQRRNTCGTLYVGTTMSAPNKEATIKVGVACQALHPPRPPRSAASPVFFSFFHQSVYAASIERTYCKRK
jgi:WW domain